MISNVRNRMLGGGIFILILAASCGGQTKTSVTTTNAATTIATATTPPLSASPTSTPSTEPSKAAASAVDNSSGWVALDDKGAVYISWLDVDGKLTGSIQIATRKTGSTDVTATNQQFTGQHDRSQISLDIAVLGLRQGVLNDKLLTLRIPQKDGTISELVLNKGGIDSYNAGVRALQGDAASAKAAAADTAAAAAAAKQTEAELRSAGDAVTNSVTKLNDEVGNLAGIMATYDVVSHDNMEASLAVVDTLLAADPVYCQSVRASVRSLESSRLSVDSLRNTLDIWTSSVTSKLANLQRDADQLTATNPAMANSETAAGVAYWAKVANDAVASSIAKADANDRYADQVVASGKAKLVKVCPVSS